MLVTWQVPAKRQRQAAALRVHLLLRGMGKEMYTRLGLSHRDWPTYNYPKSTLVAEGYGQEADLLDRD